MQGMRKLLTFLCVGALVASIAGCGKKAPTSDELLAKPFGEESAETIKANIKVNISVKGDKGSSGVQSTIAYTYGEQSQYMEGTVVTDVMGQSVETSTKAYRVKDESGSWLTYDFDADNNVWTYQIDMESTGSEFLDLLKLDTSLVSNAEVKKSGDTVTMTGKIETSFIEGMNFTGDIDITSIPYLVFTGVYDAKTNVIKSMTITVPADVEQEGTVFNIAVDSIEVNVPAVTLPDEVKSTAVEATGDDTYGGGDRDLSTGGSAIGKLDEGAESGSDEEEKELEEPGEVNGVEVSSGIMTWKTEEATSDNTLKGNDPGDGSQYIKDIVFGADSNITPWDIGYKIIEEYGHEVDYYVTDSIYQFMVSATPNDIISAGGYPAEYWDGTNDSERLAWAYLYDFGCLSDDMVTGMGLPLDKIKEMQPNL